MSTCARGLAGEIMLGNFLDIDPGWFDEGDGDLFIARGPDVPFTPTMLDERRDTHLLVAVPDLSIKALHDQKRSKGLFHDQTIYDRDRHQFLRTRTPPTWHLVRKGAVPGSFELEHDAQNALLESPEKVCRPRALIYALLAFKWKTGMWLWPEENLRLRTCVYTDMDTPVYVCLVGNTIRINSWSAGDVGPTFGLSSECRS